MTKEKSYKQSKEYLKSELCTPHQSSLRCTGHHLNIHTRRIPFLSDLWVRVLRSEVLGVVPSPVNRVERVDLDILRDRKCARTRQSVGRLLVPQNRFWGSPCRVIKLLDTSSIVERSSAQKAAPPIPAGAVTGPLHNIGELLVHLWLRGSIPVHSS